MDELLDVILRSIVTYEDEITVDRQENPHFISFKVKVHPDDTGKLIGKGGVMANAIRTILKTAVVKLAQSKKITFEVLQERDLELPQPENDKVFSNWNPS